ncbi:hypothetical protein [Rhizobium sp. FKL33]|uniref:hypothetical protein n=1 Tax=Rhizobium sp. FKL33 TaxID=2562307 RepID=UPI0010C077E0|nr:hypothetical protein [Rhizobium sp. FKL33]
MTSVKMAIDLLAQSKMRVSIWPGADHEITWAEQLVMSTEPFQRLRRLRQIGLAYHGLPMAEHTRFSHSIGTVYWSVLLLEMSTSLNRPSPSEVGRTDLEASLGADFSLELLVRLFALLHDVALLPLGHTLRFQFKRVHGPDTFRVSMRQCLAAVLSGCEQQLEHDGSTESTVLYNVLRRHIAVVECIAHVPRILGGSVPTDLLADVGSEVLQLLPVLTFVYDLVHGVYAADIIDVCYRDLWAIGRDWKFPLTLAKAGAALPVSFGAEAWPLGPARDNPNNIPLIYRYGLKASNEGAFDASILTDLYRVHESRYDVAEKGFYHPRKCAADAMLDKCLRTITERRAEGWEKLLDANALLELGDDEYLDRILNHCGKIGDFEFVSGLKTGVLFEPACRIDLVLRADLESTADELFESPSRRTGFEEELARAVPSLSPTDIIVNVLPKNMQAKSVDTLVALPGKLPTRLETLSARLGLPAGASTLAEQYSRLRRITILVAHTHRHLSDQLAKAVEDLLEVRSSD